MGLALARQAYYMGANVTLILGNFDKSQENLNFIHKINCIKVTSANQMYDAVMHIYNHENYKQQVTHSKNNIFIGVAAVADWTPEIISEHKQKKQHNTNSNSINLIKTQDILASVASLEYRPFCIGFAAETQNLIEYAQNKLKNKNLDMIVANLISDGFAKDTNKVYIISKNVNSYKQIQELEELEEMDKNKLAFKILSKI
jgi:phosphopantothenoylcysteine decarboxylase/phosphopantothenate--cysteine ligase